MIEVFERHTEGRKEKTVCMKWKGPFDKETAELVGYRISEEHNGSDKYIVKKKQIRFT